jgi:sulfite reductase (NADPH) hemoprotein beta-component
VQLSPDQDILLVGIRPEDRPGIEAAFHSAGIPTGAPDPLEARALACVALPLCGLALTEAERTFPQLLAILRGGLERHGLGDRAPVFRVTGCSNGCARPYSAELALVGQTARSYALFAGGDPEGTRLAFEVAEKVDLAALPEVLDRLLGSWKREGREGERLGDFAARLGREALAEALDCGGAIPRSVRQTP